MAPGVRARVAACCCVAGVAMACLPDFCEAGGGGGLETSICLGPEVLQTRTAELRRKVRDEQQKQAPDFTSDCCQSHLLRGQEGAQRKVSLVEDEVGLCEGCGSLAGLASPLPRCPDFEQRQQLQRSAAS